MTFEFSFRNVYAKALVGLIVLIGFAQVVRRAEAVFFADRLSKIPLFGTELAIQNRPNDPQFEYELGNYWLIAARQPDAALPHFRRATLLNPLNGHYWAASALASQQLGDATKAEDAAYRSLSVDPTTPELLWQAANVYAYLGQQDKAADAIERFVVSSPEQVPVAAQLGWRVLRDSHLILDRVLPKGVNSDLSLLIALVRGEDPTASGRIAVLDTDPDNLFLHHLATLATSLVNENVASDATGDVDLDLKKEKARAEMSFQIDRMRGADFAKTETELAQEHERLLQRAYLGRQRAKSEKAQEDGDVYEAARIAWARLLSEPGSFDARLALPYLQMLIDADLSDSAQSAWEGLVRREGRLAKWSSDSNLIKNASFEYEPLNGGFDWQYTPSSLNDLAIDHQIAKAGGSALRVRFKDQPVSDAGIIQYVAVKPHTAYEFSGFLKADSIEAATGARLQVEDNDSDAPYFLSTDIRGTTGWTKINGRFMTRDTAHFVNIRVVRDPGNTLIKGTVWVDALRLTEAGTN